MHFLVLVCRKKDASTFVFYGEKVCKCFTMEICVEAAYITFYIKVQDFPSGSVYTASFRSFIIYLN